MELNINFTDVYKFYAHKHLNALRKQALEEVETLIRENPHLAEKFAPIRKRILDVHGDAVRDIDFLCDQINKF